MSPSEVDADPEVSDVLKRVVELVTRERPLTGNQLHDLAAQLNRMATHRIVEEHLRQRGRHTPE